MYIVYYTIETERTLTNYLKAVIGEDNYEFTHIKEEALQVPQDQAEFLAGSYTIQTLSTQPA